MVGIVARKGGKTKGLAKIGRLPKGSQRKWSFGISIASMLLKRQYFQAFHLVGKVRFALPEERFARAIPD